MSNTHYTSKYPRIIMDSIGNSANESMKKTLTVEEYYDLLHHTHDAASIVNNHTGDTSYSELQTSVAETQQIVNNLKQMIEQLTTNNNDLQQTVNTLNTTIEELTNNNAELRAIMKTQAESIEVIQKEMESLAPISDWDAETPGNQDVNGNTIGTLMGFDMQEIE